MSSQEKASQHIYQESLALGNKKLEHIYRPIAQNSNLLWFMAMGYGIKTWWLNKSSRFDSDLPKPKGHMDNMDTLPMEEVEVKTAVEDHGSKHVSNGHWYLGKGDVEYI